MRSGLLVEEEEQEGFELRTFVSGLNYHSGIGDSRSGVLQDPLLKKEKYNS